MLHDEEEGDDVGAARPAVDEVGERRGVLARREIADERRRMRPEHVEHARDRRFHAGDASEREARGAERDDLAIRRIVVSRQELHGILRRVGDVERLVEFVEARLQVGVRRVAPSRVPVQNVVIG